MKKKSFKTLLIISIMLISLFGSTLTVFAEYTDAKSVIQDYGAGGNKGMTVLPASIAGAGVLTSAPSSSANIESATVGTVTYFWDSANNDAIIKAGNALEKKETARQNDEQNLATFSEVTNNMNIAADVGTASGILSGFTGVLSTLLGIIVVLVSVGMTVFSGFDLCYIAFPVFRNKCEDAKQSGTGIMAGKGKTASGETKLRFVSDDAQYAVVAADTVQSGKNPFVIYFGKRLISYIVLAILLFVLLTGRVTIFTDIALKLVSGILDIIQSI